MSSSVRDIDTSTEGQYILWVYGEWDILANVLYAVANYKNHMGAVWPTSAIVHSSGRMKFELGKDTELVRKHSGFLVNALYLSTYKPLMDDDARMCIATRLTCERVAHKPLRFRKRAERKAIKAARRSK